MIIDIRFSLPSHFKDLNFSENIGILLMRRADITMEKTGMNHIEPVIDSIN